MRKRDHVEGGGKSVIADVTLVNIMDAWNEINVNRLEIADD